MNHLSPDTDHFGAGDVVHVLDSPLQAAGRLPVRWYHVTGETGRHVTGVLGVWLAQDEQRVLAAPGYLFHTLPQCADCAARREVARAGMLTDCWGDTPPHEVTIYALYGQHLVSAEDSFDLPVTRATC